MEFKINVLAILVTVIANFFLGFIWYTPLFGKIWGKEMGYDPDMKVESKVFIKGLIFMVIGNFFFAWVLAHNITAWSFVPGMDEMDEIAIIMSSAFFTWLGFYLPGELGGTVWEKKSWKLFGINTGYHLASLILASFILHLWK
jgi:hypothetical protein